MQWDYGAFGWIRGGNGVADLLVCAARLVKRYCCFCSWCLRGIFYITKYNSGRLKCRHHVFFSPFSLSSSSRTMLALSLNILCIWRLYEAFDLRGDVLEKALYDGSHDFFFPLLYDASANDAGKTPLFSTWGAESVFKEGSHWTNCFHSNSFNSGIPCKRSAM